MDGKSLEAIAEQLRQSGTVHAPELGAENLTACVRLRCAADVEPESISWLWDGWLAKGKLALLAGTPGTGKTTLAMALAATISTAGRWPDGTPCREVGSVLIWSGEDGLADTLIPRLMAAGVDRSRVHFLEGVTEDGQDRPFDPATDMACVAAALEKIGDVRLLIIDPIVSAVKGNAHHANEVRRDLQPIVDYAMKHHCAVIGITHFAKGTAGSNPLERVLGSQAFGALARVVMVAAKDENSEGGRVLARAKSNIGQDDGGVSYTLEQVTLDGGISASRVLWGNKLVGNAREILGDVESTSVDGASPLELAVEFLREQLASGPVNQKTLQADAIGAGHSYGTIRRAKEKLGIVATHPVIPGPWYWHIPDADDTPQALKNSQGAHQNPKVLKFPGVNALGVSERLGTPFTSDMVDGAVKAGCEEGEI